MSLPSRVSGASRSMRQNGDRNGMAEEMSQPCFVIPVISMSTEMRRVMGSAPAPWVKDEAKPGGVEGGRDHTHMGSNVREPWEELTITTAMDRKRVRAKTEARGELIRNVSVRDALSVSSDHGDEGQAEGALGLLKTHDAWHVADCASRTERKVARHGDGRRGRACRAGGGRQGGGTGDWGGWRRGVGVQK